MGRSDTFVATVDQAGWPGTPDHAIAAAVATPSVAEGLADVLVRVGVRAAYGLVGGSIVALCDALARSELRVLHFRHEGGAGFAATEASLASGKPVAVFATTGPGITNAITGMTAARWEGAKVVLVSGSTSSAQRGRWACQETSPVTSPMDGIFSAGPIFHYAATIGHPTELSQVASRLAAGMQRRGGFVAHVNVPIAVQSAQLAAPLRMLLPVVETIVPDAAAIERHARLLLEEPFVIWAGFGARRAAALVRELAARTGSPVISSPRGKGVFPEDHPQFVGVTGIAGYGSFEHIQAERRPAHALVLGTRMGEYSSLWDPGLVPSRAFVHVDLDPDVHGAAYPGVPTIAVHAEVGAYLEALLEHIPRRKALPPRLELVPRSTSAPREEGPVRPTVLMEAIQQVVVDGSDAILIADAGNSFAWANHLLRFDEPRYRVSMGFGSMGHAVAGVVGIALATGRKAVGLVGDGAMMMLNEISTAVQYKAHPVWVVLNDGMYGMVEQGMNALGFRPVETAIPPADFVAFSRAMGGDGIHVRHEHELHAALEKAMAAELPFVVDVTLDTSELAPFLNRVRSLKQQAGAAGGAR